MVEVAFATASVTTILLAGFSLIGTVTGTTAVLVPGFEEFRGKIAAVERLRDDLSRAQIVSLGQDGASITYRLPVVPKGASTVLDSYGEIRWGISDRGGPRTGGYCTVSFKFDRLRSEPEERRDINGDGDKLDIFEEGRLQRTSDRGHKMPLSRIRTIVVAGDRDGDINADGFGDPIFSLSASGVLTVRLARPHANSPVEIHVLKIKPIESAASHE